MSLIPDRCKARCRSCRLYYLDIEHRRRGLKDEEMEMEMKMEMEMEMEMEDEEGRR